MIREFDGITMRFHSFDADAAVWIEPNKHLAAGQSMNNDVLPGHTNSLRGRGTSVAYPKAAARDRLHVADITSRAVHRQKTSFAMPAARYCNSSSSGSAVSRLESTKRSGSHQLGTRQDACS